jgi:hypothetical protein
VPVNPTRRDWARLLHELDDGRAYNRNLPDLAAALYVVQAAFGRRPYVRDRAAAGKPY